MVYGLCADLHFHRWSAFASVTPEGLNTRLVGLLDELERCCRETRHADGDLVVLAGDIFHVRGSVAPTVLNPVIDRIRHCIATHKVKLVILSGNHDLEGKDSERLGSAVTALEAIDGVTVVNEPTVIGNLVLVPWFEDIEQLKARIVKLRDGLFDTAFGGDTDVGREYDLILHAPIDGVIEGLPAHGLTAEWLAERSFKRVFAGHYHNHKWLCPGIERKGGSVYSIGALAHHTWSDVGSKAGFLLVHDHDVTWRKSHLPGFVDLDRLVDVEADELPFLIEGNYVRVKVEAAQTKVVNQVREDLTKMGAAGVLIMATPTPPTRDAAVTVSVAAGASLEASIGEFTKALGDRAAAVLKASLEVLSAADAVEVA